MKFRPLPAAIAALLDAAAERHGIAATLARGVAWVESRGDAKAISPAGAMGVMQLMPIAARDLGVDALDAAQNIDGGVRFLSRLLKKYGGDEARALAAYNWGPGNLDDAIRDGKQPPLVTQQYVRNVLARKAEEGSRDAASPFSGWSHLQVRCPGCGCEVVARVELELSK